ncbi:MAG: nuclear transport factor 2 family protein [Bacteroidota bacterium]
MKTILVSMMSLGMLLTVACAQPQQPNVMENPEVGAIKTVIQQFSKAGDQRDVAALKNLLHENYRVIFNRAFGSDAMQIMDKATYVQLIEAGKIGGDQRKVEIVSVDVEEHIASVKVIQTSEKAIFRSYMILAKDANQQWKLVSDTPWAKFLE